MVSGRKLSFKGILYKRLRVLSYDCIIIIIMIIMMALFSISTTWLFICKIHVLQNTCASKYICFKIHLLQNTSASKYICFKIHLLQNISAKKIQRSYFFQKRNTSEVHLLTNKIKNIGEVKKVYLFSNVK